jgi:very-short-patch-repair endonuclease
MKKSKVGDKFNRWTLVEQLFDENNKSVGWICECECGNKKRINDIASVRCGRSRSCGCLKTEVSINSNPMHNPETREKVRNKMLNNDKQKEILARAVEASRSPETKEKRKQTNKIKYGGNSPASSIDVKNKMRQTNLDIRGVCIPAQDTSVLNKMKETNIERYGVDNIMKDKDVAARVGASLSKTLRERSKYRCKDGKTLVEICKENNIIPTSARNLIYQGNDIDFVEKWVESYKKHISSLETRLVDAINREGIVAERWDKKTEDYRLDIKISDKLYVEADGLFWHSEIKKSDKKYHLKKRERLDSAGIRVLQFREDEIINKEDIVVSMISAAAGKSTKIGARKTELKSVGYECAAEFFNANHLMGSGPKARCIGLFCDGDLVCCLSFKRFKDGLDIVRFASKKGVVVQGGLSRLLSFLEKKKKPAFIQSFVDLRYGNGKSLEALGYSRESTILGWQWTDLKKTYNRQYCKATEDMTEKEHADKLKLYKIYDAGQAKYIKYLDKV